MSGSRPAADPVCSAGSVYVYLTSKGYPSAKTSVFKPGRVMFDYDALGQLIGIEVLDAVAVTVDGREVLAIEAGLDVERLIAGAHDVICNNEVHRPERPSFGWDCERAGRRIFDVYTGQVVDWEAIARLRGGER